MATIASSSPWMKNIIPSPGRRFKYSGESVLVEKGAGSDGQKMTYNIIKQRLGDLFYRLVSQKFKDPAEGEAAAVAKFSKLHEDLTTGFRNLEDEMR